MPPLPPPLPPLPCFAPLFCRTVKTKLYLNDKSDTLYHLFSKKYRGFCFFNSHRRSCMSVQLQFFKNKR